MDAYDTRMNELLLHTAKWQPESRVAYIRPRIAEMYDATFKANKARSDAAHEAKFGKTAQDICDTIEVAAIAREIALPTLDPNTLPSFVPAIARAT